MSYLMVVVGVVIILIPHIILGIVEIYPEDYVRN